MIRVGVAGARGRLGRVACTALAGAEGIALVAGLARSDIGQPIVAVSSTASGSAVPIIAGDLETFLAVPMDVVIECTLYPFALDVARAAIARGVSPVIGSSAWSVEDVKAIDAACRAARVGGIFAPNFSLGAVMMIRLAQEAARVLPRAEIVEYHHDTKRDAPSGTSRATAMRIGDVTGAEVPIHSVRLPGLVAHQEVLFGGLGELLTIRHDSFSRESNAPGIVLAARHVREQTGLTRGLEHVLFPAAV